MFIAQVLFLILFDCAILQVDHICKLSILSINTSIAISQITHFYLSTFRHFVLKIE